MTSLDNYRDMVKQGFPDRESLMTIQPLKDLDEIIPLFDEDLTYRDFIELNGILRQKYIVEDQTALLKDLDFGELELPVDTRTIYMMGSKTSVLDFSSFEALEKIFLVGARKVEKLILPKRNCLKALGLSSMTNLDEIGNISLQTGLRYLHFDANIKLENFDFIRDLNHLIYLSFTGNHKLPELDFISPDSELRFLDFVDTNIFKYPSTITYLREIKRLRFLTTGTTNQKQRDILRAELPHVCMREG